MIAKFSFSKLNSRHDAQKIYLGWVPLGILAFSGCLLFVPAEPVIRLTEAERIAELGQRALAEGQYVEARSSFEQLAKLNPKLAEVPATLAIGRVVLSDHSARKGTIPQNEGSVLTDVAGGGWSYNLFVTSRRA